MKRFKLIFHIIYVLVTLAVMYFSVDILMNTEAYLSKVKLSSYIKFPRYVMGLFLFISVLMMIEYALHQMAVFKDKGKFQDLEEEIVQLKAKLYDKGQDDIDEEEANEEEDPEEDTD